MVVVGRQAVPKRTLAQRVLGRANPRAARRWLASLGCASTALSAAAWADGTAAAAPLQIDVGVMSGVTVYGSKTGLGDAENPKDIPGVGPILGVHGGVVLMDGHLGLEAALRNTFTELKSGNSSANVLGYRVRGLWYFMNEGVARPFVLLGGGQDILINGKKQCKLATDKNCMWVRNPDLDEALEVGVGVKVPLTYRLSLRAVAEVLVGNGRPKVADFSPAFEAQVGATWSFGGPPEDGDKDGIPDEADKCPAQAEDKDGFQDQDGCPDEDNDGDGLLDAKDKCPNEAEDLDRFQDDDGCPDPDNDGDGIPDAKDKCPDKAETKNGWQDEDGCPDVADSDGDGIPNNADKCPTQAEDKDGFQDEDGCPDPDNDGDGILDAADKCPGKPETKNGFQDEDGCPDQLAEAVQKLFAAPQTKIEFKADKLTKDAEAHLNALLEFLLEQEAIKIEVAVQPDAEADPALTLAKNRAEAVKAWLVERGIDGARVRTATTPAASTPFKPGKGGVVAPNVVFKML